MYDNQTDQIIDQNNLINYYYTKLKPLTNILLLNPEIRSLNLNHSLKQITIKFAKTKQDKQPYLVIHQIELSNLTCQRDTNQFQFDWSNTHSNEVVWYLNTDGIYGEGNNQHFLLTINRSIDSTRGLNNLLYDCPELFNCKAYWLEHQKIQDYAINNKITLTYTEILRNHQLNRTQLICHHWKRLTSLSQQIDFNQFDLMDLNMIRGLNSNVTPDERQRVINWLLQNHDQFHRNVTQITFDTMNTKSTDQWKILYIAYLNEHFLDLSAGHNNLTDDYQYLNDFITYNKRRLKSHHKLEFPQPNLYYYLKQN